MAVSYTHLDVYKRQELAYRIVELVNEERERKGKDELEINDELMESAMVRAEEAMGANSGEEHMRPDGSSCFTAITVEYITAAENISYSGDVYKRQMFMGAYHTAGEADAFQRDSERLYLWDEEQWENMNQTSYGKKPGEESRDSNGDYIISKMPVGLLDIELLSTGPYIDTAVTVQNEKRAAAVTFRSDTWGQWENAEGRPVERIEYRIGGEDDFQSWDCLLYTSLRRRCPSMCA